MKPVVLLGLNARYSHSNPALYALRMAASSLCIDIRIMEFSINADPGTILDAVLGADPCVVALSVYIWNAALAGRILDLLHMKAPGVKALAGGPEVSYTADEWLAGYPSLEWIVAGPGEAAFAMLAGGNFSAPRGVVRSSNPPFREIPFPYRAGDFPGLANRYIYYESSRGCPFHCLYCLSSRGDQSLEFRDIEQVKRELDILAAGGFPAVKFVDRTFNIRPSHSRAVWNHIIDSYGEGKTAFHFEVMASRLEEEDFSILGRAPRGLIQLEAGVQTVHPATLECIERHDDPGRAIQALKRLSAMGNIHVHVDLLAGLPGEGMDHIRESFNRIYTAGPDHIQLGFLKVLHGTVMRDRAGEWGIRYTPFPPFAVLETPDVPADDMELLRGVASLLDTLYDESPFHETLNVLEEKYPSPFDLFLAMARGMRVMAKDMKTRSWEANGIFLLDFAGCGHPSLLPVVRDALCWDWCVTGRSHRYPPFLAGDVTRLARKTGCEETGGKDSTSVIYFMAETDRFRERTDGKVMAFPAGSPRKL